MTPGEYMELAREKAGLTKKELSKISGIRYQTICNAEKDRFSPTLFTVMCLADALKISIDEYVGRTVPRR